MTPWERVRRYADKHERCVIGLMSGTSVDGVDAALVRIRGSARQTQIALEAFVTHPFPAGLRHDVLALSHGEGNAERVSQTSFALGALFADAAFAVLAAAGVGVDALDAVASHGQTVSHTALPAVSSGAPSPRPRGLGTPSPKLGRGEGPAEGGRGEGGGPPAKTGATLQIGEAAVLAQRLHTRVVSDFRVADVAAGGQGAPLVPYADWCLLTHPTRARAIQNIGGIGNVTFLPADAVSNQVIGFDTGPGNMLMDRAAQHVTGGRLRCDTNGQLARAGVVHEAMLSPLLRHPFLDQPPPRSAGREEFGEAFWRDVIASAERLRVTSADLLATLTAFTAQTIADACRRFLPALPDEVIVGGGGARNPALMEMLRDILAPIPIRTHEDIGMNGDAKEALAFAVLANETLLGRPSNLPSVTGAARPVVLGKLTLP